MTLAVIGGGVQEEKTIDPLLKTRSVGCLPDYQAINASQFLQKQSGKLACSLRDSRHSRTAGCSMVLVTTCGRPELDAVSVCRIRAAATAPQIAQLSLSVPQDVKKISSAAAPIISPTCLLASSTATLHCKIQKVLSKIGTVQRGSFYKNRAMQSWADSSAFVHYAIWIEFKN